MKWVVVWTKYRELWVIDYYLFPRTGGASSPLKFRALRLAVSSDPLASNPWFPEHGLHGAQVLCVYLRGAVPTCVEFSQRVVQSLGKTIRIRTPKNLLCDLSTLLSLSVAPTIKGGARLGDLPSGSCNLPVFLLGSEA